MLLSVVSAAAIFIIASAVLTRILMKTVILRIIEMIRILDELETNEHMAEYN
ncbi:MAG: hypothetical protein LUE92_03275 [Clostridiales bacterium]|nr:hypothetical protein [Clostridiales bacterium]